MGLRERLSKRLDLSQRLVFGIFFGLAFSGNVLFELFLTTTYTPHLMHMGLVFGLILIIFNPEGIRPLLFFFFVFLMVKIFRPHYGDYLSDHDFDHLLFAFPFYLTSTYYDTIGYFHIALYALLAYFAWNNPFKSSNTEDSRLIDQSNDENYR